MDTLFKKKSFDVWVLVALPILAAIVTVILSTNKFTSTLLFFGLPILYLIWKNPSIFKKSFAFAFLFSIPLSIFIDTLAVFDGGWYIPESVVPFRLFGVATFEVYLFGLLWVLFAILFYEYFFDRHTKRDWFPRVYRRLFYLFTFLIMGVTVLFFIKPSLLVIPYFYTWVSVIFVVSSLVWFLMRQPKFLKRFTIQGVYFFFVLLLFEVVALQVGQWTFPGKHFIGWINLFGYSFPFEELVFWMILATPSLLAYYEFFADDKKL